MKHLTFKTVFLFALGSGKRRSEIHAWQNRNIRHQSDWSKVSLYPSPSFLSKNQLAKEGPDSVAPGVITGVDPRSLCPVRVLRYYLDRTSGRIRRWFLSPLKKVSTKTSHLPLSPLGSNRLLCYELSDQEAHTLHQVKVHDVRAFAAFKVFQSGDPILSDCH